MQVWVFNHSQVVKPHLKNDNINTNDYVTGEVIKTQKLIIQRPIRELQNSLIKPSQEGGFYGSRSESGDLIIGG